MSPVYTGDILSGIFGNGLSRFCVSQIFSGFSEEITNIRKKMFLEL